MKKQLISFPLLISTICAFEVVTCISNAQLPVDLSDGLAAYYSLNGNANDSSANGNHGVASNVSYGLDRFGNANGAAYFGYSNGSSWVNFGDMGNVLCPGLNSLQNYPITYSVWCKLSGYQTWISSYGSQGGVMTLIGKEGSGYQDAALALYTRNGVYSSQLSYLGSSWEISSFKPNLNEWYNIVFSIDPGGNQTFYVNGAKVFEANSPTIANCSTDIPFRIGASSSYGSPNDYRVPFDGYMSDVGVWNSVLSSTQVSQLYSLQSVPEPSTYALLLLSGAASLWALKRRKS
jgi:hypothetical protein